MVFIISDEDAWDTFVLASSKLYHNSPFNPMSWIRAYNYWIWGEGERPDRYDWGAKAVWAAPAPMAALLYPDVSFGYIRSAMAITSGMTVPSIAVAGSWSPAVLPMVAAGGLLNTMTQMSWWPHPEVTID